MNISKKRLDNILFLDIETVPVIQAYNDLTEEGKQLWDLKARNLTRFISAQDLPPDPVDLYEQKAGIYAEFAKVVCISIGYLKLGDEIKLRIKSFAGDDEKDILSGFADIVDKHFNNPNKDFLCGHNIKEFDIPFLCRRMIINKVPFPNLLEIGGKKPWELSYLLDTLHMWKFGDYKNYTSLRLLSYSLGIPSPKDDMDGSQVAEVYYREKNIEKIIKYCEKDVHTTVKVFLKLIGFDAKEVILERAG